MLRILCTLLVLLLAWPATAQRPIHAEYVLDVTGDIEIAPDGSVHSYAFDPGLSPEVAKVVGGSVNDWRFEPIAIEGRPVIAKTRMRLSLRAVPVAEEFRLQVSNVWFGEPERRHQMAPPRYPADAARIGLGARVVLVLKLDAEGNVDRVHPEQISLAARAPNEKIAERWRRRFEQSSAAAARQWEFSVSEIIDGKPVGTTVRVPVEYVIATSRNRDDTWRAFLPGPKRPVPWVTDSSIAGVDRSSELAEGGLQPLESRFKLQTDVVGTTL